MKKVQVITEHKVPDFSLCQWVRHVHDTSFIILTTGSHAGTTFVGTALPCDLWPDGHYSLTWVKEEFTELTTEIPFIISNED